MKQIPLTQGQVALVDDEDFERVNQYKWQANQLNYGDGFVATAWSHGSHAKRKILYMHRFIMNTPKGMVCDHINHHTLDNRKSNLRNCSRSQNQMNRKHQKNNKLGIKGIRLNGNRYQAIIHKNKKRVWYESFYTLEEAIAARDEAVQKYHGEFACKE